MRGDYSHLIGALAAARNVPKMFLRAKSREAEMKPRTAVVASGVIVLLVGALAGYLYGVDSTPRATTTGLSTVTVSTSGSAYDQVADSFANHMLSLSERNATVTWVGAVDEYGLAGLYNRTEIPLLMRESFIGKGTSFTMGNLTLAITVISADSATVNSTFEIFGQGLYVAAIPGPVYTAFNATVSAEDSYAYSTPNNAWLISNETWSFTSFNTNEPTG
jgi:hypothetical protein